MILQLKGKLLKVNQTIKGIIKYLTVVLIIILTVLLCFKSCSANEYKVKTEYGDQFIVFCDSFGDLYTIDDVNSNFSTDLYYFNDKKQIHAICDNQYIRCYRISDGSEDGYKDKFIFKIKKYDEFFSVRYGDVKYSSEYMFKDDAIKVKNELLCDSTLMEICLPDLDSLYHDELREMSEKFINKDFKGLDKYGLTEEMIQDTKSLEEKTKILKNYFNL